MFFGTGSPVLAIRLAGLENETIGGFTGEENVRVVVGGFTVARAFGPSLRTLVPPRGGGGKRPWLPAVGFVGGRTGDPHIGRSKVDLVDAVAAPKCFFGLMRFRLNRIGEAFSFSLPFSAAVSRPAGPLGVARAGVEGGANLRPSSTTGIKSSSAFRVAFRSGLDGGGMDDEKLNSNANGADAGGGSDAILTDRIDGELERSTAPVAPSEGDFGVKEGGILAALIGVTLDRRTEDLGVCAEPRSDEERPRRAFFLVDEMAESEGSGMADVAGVAGSTLAFFVDLESGSSLLLSSLE